MKKKSWWILGLSLAFFVLTSILLSIFNSNVDKIYPNLAIQPDFILNHTPHLNILWLGNSIIALAAISFLIYLFVKKKTKYLPFYLTIIGVYLLLRGLLIYITPLGNPDPSYLGCTILLRYFGNCSWGGMFPSGHVGTIFLYFLFTLKNKTKNWSIYFLILVILEIISLILSKAHYTIDIVGGLFIAYGIWKIFDEHFKKKLTLK